jgi:hypothetical protein
LSNLRELEFVARWDQFAWIAGTTRYNVMGQGATLKEAIDSLLLCLESCVVWARQEGREPFYKDPGPIDEFRSAKDCLPLREGIREPQRSRRYTGNVILDMNVKR